MWETFAIFALALFYFAATAARLGMHADESQWIAYSSSFERFLALDLEAPEWQPGEAALTQPPLARYAIGAGRRMGGFGVESLNKPWDFRFALKQNVENGAEPSRDLLICSRLPITLLSAAALAILFAMLCEEAGRIACYSLVVLVFGNELLCDCVCRALGEPALFFFVALALPAAVMQLRAQSRPRSAPLLSGAVAGLAASCKLNGSLLLGAFAACELLASRQRSSVKPPAGGNRGGGVPASLFLMAIAAFTVWCTLNPFLYFHPVRRSIAMLEFRLDQIAQQQAAYPQKALRSLGATALTAPLRIFRDYAPVTAGGMTLPVNALLAACGLVVLTVGARRGRPFPTAFLAVAACTALPAVFTPLDWDRYYFLPVYFETILVAIATGKLLARLCPE